MRFTAALILSLTIFVMISMGANQTLAAAAISSTGPWQQQVIKEIESIYLPAQSELGLNLKFQIDNDSTSEYAKAERDGSNAVVTVSSIMLASPRLSPDGLRMIICHELGHVLGGFPRRHVPMEWSGSVAHDGLSETSSEGQADYYASLVCFRRVVAGQNHTSLLPIKPLPTRAVKLCNASHGAQTEAALICLRAAAAADNMLQLTKDFAISFESPNDKIAEKLISDSYPDRQCRLDTFLSGAICKTPIQTDKSGLALDFNNSNLNECAQTEGRRPPCWYR